MVLFFHQPLDWQCPGLEIASRLPLVRIGVLATRDDCNEPTQVDREDIDWF
jgi:hypothetical protein